MKRQSGRIRFRNLHKERGTLLGGGMARKNIQTRPWGACGTDSSDRKTNGDRKQFGKGESPWLGGERERQIQKTTPESVACFQETKIGPRRETLSKVRREDPWDEEK